MSPDDTSQKVGRLGKTLTWRRLAQNPEVTLFEAVNYSNFAVPPLGIVLAVEPWQRQRPGGVNSSRSSVQERRRLPYSVTASRYRIVTFFHSLLVFITNRNQTFLPIIINAWYTIVTGHFLAKLNFQVETPRARRAGRRVRVTPLSIYLYPLERI